MDFDDLLIVDPIPGTSVALAYPHDVDSLTAAMSPNNLEATIHPAVPTNDPLSMHVEGAGQWGLPSQPEDDPGAELLASSYQYGHGVLVGLSPNEADAFPAGYMPAGMLREAGIPASTYQTPHEATHRRFEPPQTTPIKQAAAGFTLIAPPNMGLHYVKILGCFLTLDAAGTLKFVQGDAAGISVADMTGAMNLGGAAVPGLALPVAEIQNPWLFASPDQAVGIFTVTGKAQGWIVWCYAPFDQ